MRFSSGEVSRFAKQICLTLIKSTGLDKLSVAICSHDDPVAHICALAPRVHDTEHMKKNCK